MPSQRDTQPALVLVDFPSYPSDMSKTGLPSISWNANDNHLTWLLLTEMEKLPCSFWEGHCNCRSHAVTTDAYLMLRIHPSLGNRNGR